MSGDVAGNARAPLRRIAVVGGGPVALAAATGFAMAIPTAAVHLVPAALTADALADRWPLVLPSAQAMLARLGLPPQLLLARDVARPRLASRFAGWSRDGAPWLVADDASAPAGPVVLHHLWLRAAAAGRPAQPFHATVPACAAALAGQPVPGIEPTLDCDPAALGRVLGPLAGRQRVALAAPLAGAEAGNGGIAALHLADGSRHLADLFVDASGPARLLAGTTAFVGWGDALPCDRLLVTDTADPGTPLLDGYTATPTGWRAEWPGAIVHGFAAATGAPQVAGSPFAIAPGRLAQPWTGNVLALGDAAVQVGPLGRTGFTLALAHLALALELLPGRDDEPLLRAEYNRRAGLRADRLRDFLALPYRAVPRGGKAPAGPFWRAQAAAPLPPSLTAALVQFARRGDVPAADEETVPRDAWVAVLLGMGLRPERANPIALSLPPAAAAAAIAARMGASPPFVRSRPPA